MSQRRFSRTEAVPLRGSLAYFPAWEVVQWIALSAPEGVLELECTRGGHRRQTSLQCCDGVLVSLAFEEDARQGPVRTDSFTPSPDRLGGLLLTRGVLGLPRLRLALALQHEERRRGRRSCPLGQSLLAAGAITADELGDALRTLARDRFMDLLSWGSGRFRFRAGRRRIHGLPVGERLERWLIESAVAQDGARRAEPQEKAEG
jgi:hypothetical protein